MGRDARIASARRRRSYFISFSFASSINMNRTLLGVASLIGVVGLGSAGVYFGHDALESSVPAPLALEQPADAPPRDLRPTPIPLGGQRESSARPNPFARPVAAERVAPTDDRYSERRRPSNGDIPDARDVPSDEGPMRATRSADPFGLRDQSAPTRYPERPAAAELPDAEPIEDTSGPVGADEEAPRALPAPAASRLVDRYGRPALASSAAANESNPADEGPARAQPSLEPQDTAEPTAALPAADEPAAGDEGTGRPGDPQLSGSQAPTLTIEKMAPAGNSNRQAGQVRHQGPQRRLGCRRKASRFTTRFRKEPQLIEHHAHRQRGPQGGLVWELGTLKPGDEQTGRAAS